MKEKPLGVNSLSKAIDIARIRFVIYQILLDEKKIRVFESDFKFTGVLFPEESDVAHQWIDPTVIKSIDCKKARRYLFVAGAAAGAMVLIQK